jgi:hypothetical protein
LEAPADAVTESAHGDTIHAMLMNRAEELAGCTEGSYEESEFEAINLAIDAYESVRWPTRNKPSVSSALSCCLPIC